MTVPVRHESGPAHRRLIANALNLLSAYFNGLAESTSGDVMVSDGDGTVTWGTPANVATLQTQVPTLDTAVASTSGTSIDFTSIPSWVTSITVMFIGVSTSGTSDKVIRIGDAGGIEATGYLGAGSYVAGASTASSNYTTSFGINSGAAAHILHGPITLSLEEGSANTWVASGVIADSASAASFFTAGSKSLSATLDRVRITTVNGTDTFDAGSINIQYR